jgi:hypothetical protein
LPLEPGLPPTCYISLNQSLPISELQSSGRPGRSREASSPHTDAVPVAIQALRSKVRQPGGGLPGYYSNQAWGVFSQGLGIGLEFQAP